MKRCSSRFLCSLFLLMTVTPSSTQTVKFSRHDYPANSGPFSVIATDVNGDGFADLLVGNTIFQQGVTVLLNNHDGTFTPPIQSISHDQSADIVAIADMNSDGKPDVVFVDRFHFSISVMYGNGDGTFQLPVRAFFGGPNPNSLALADFNGDGRVDIVWAREGGAATASPPALRMMLNTGNDAQGHAQFAAPVDILTSIDSTQNFFSVTTGDLNGDGKPDLAFLICCSSNPATPVIATEAFGHADGTFTLKQVDSGNALRVQLANFGDSRAALVMPFSRLCTGCAQGVTVIFNVADGTTRKTVKTFTGTEFLTGFAAVGDYNGDGLVDIAMTASTSMTIPDTPGQEKLVIYKANGTRSFSDQLVFPLGSGSGVRQVVSTRFRHQVRGDDVALVEINTHSVAVLTNTTSFGCLPNVPGALICSPAANSTNTAQVKLTAGAVPNSGHITALRFYINTKELQTLQNTTAPPCCREA